MSKRFGRNQRRRLRALEEKHEILTASNYRMARRLGEIPHDWKDVYGETKRLLNLIKWELGKDNLFASEVQEVPFSPGRERTAVRQKMSAMAGPVLDRLGVIDIASESELLRRFCIIVERDPELLMRHILLKEVRTGDTAVYSISETTFQHAMQTGSFPPTVRDGLCSEMIDVLIGHILSVRRAA